jgi:uncharacterized RDD family membrane protein YckC
MGSLTIRSARVVRRAPTERGDVTMANPSHTLPHHHAHHPARSETPGAEHDAPSGRSAASPWRPASGAPGPSLSRVALSATLHCLLGCGIGEVLGMVIGTALGLSNAATIALAVALAFAFGYALTMRPLVASGMRLRHAARIAFAADTASIAIMEVVDNVIMLAIPGAMDAPLSSPLFWGSLAAALAVAAVAAYPVNRWLIARGAGHARVHAHHGHH